MIEFSCLPPSFQALQRPGGFGAQGELDPARGRQPRELRRRPPEDDRLAGGSLHLGAHGARAAGGGAKAPGANGGGGGAALLGLSERLGGGGDYGGEASLYIYNHTHIYIYVYIYEKSCNRD